MIKIITESEISECIKLLHKDYHTGYHLNVYNSKLDYFRKNFYKFNTYKEYHFFKVLSGSLHGCFQTERNEIDIYLFAFKETARFIKQRVILTVFHEVRHFYQQKYMYKKFKNNIENYSHKESLEYCNQPLEKDADKFAMRMCDKYCYEISVVLNVYPSWAFEHPEGR